MLEQEARRAITRRWWPMVSVWVLRLSGLALDGLSQLLFWQCLQQCFYQHVQADELAL